MSAAVTSDFGPQVHDLVKWVGDHLHFDEPLPTTVRHEQQQHFLHLFAKHKRFGLTGTYDITKNIPDPLDHTAELFAYIKSKRYPLASIHKKNINVSGGVTMPFDMNEGGVAINGSFNLFVKIVGSSRQIWGTIKASVKAEGKEETFNETLYLCPVTPPGPNFK